MLDKMSISMSEVFDTKLCRAIEVFPCLYNTHSKLYENKKTCNAAWEDISKRCNDTIINCKRRWSEIYDSYVVTVRNSEHTLTKPINNDRSNLNNCLQFLIPHIKLSLEQSSEKADEKLKSNRVIDVDDNKNAAVQRSQGSLSSETRDENDTSLAQMKNDTNIIKNEIDPVIVEGAPLSDNNIVSNDAINRQSKVETFIIKGIEQDNKTAKFMDTNTNTNTTTTITSLPSNAEQQLCNNLETMNIPKLNILETEDEVKRYNFRRHCKRPIHDDETSSEKSDKDKRKRITSSTEELNNRKTPFISPSRKLEVKVARMSFNKKFRPLKAKHSDIQKINQTSIVKKSNQEIIKRKHTKNSSVQTEFDSIHLDNDFLKSIQTQMKLMNSRQGMHFKCKVYKALMDVFDDATNFPNRNEIIDLPATGAPRFDTTTAPELHLMRELVALVQAAKQTSFVSNSDATNTAPNALLNALENPIPQTCNKNIVETKSTAVEQTAAQTNSPSAIHTMNDNEEVLGVPRHIIRKVVKVGGVHGGTVMTQEGEKKRIYRIYPKVTSSLSGSIPTQRITYSNSSQNSGGTFYITQKDQNNTNNNQILTSTASATSTSTSSSTTSNPVRTMIVNNRTVNVNNLQKAVVMRASDGSKTVLSSGGASGGIQRGTQIRLQPTQTVGRASTLSGTASATNGNNNSNTNAITASTQKMATTANSTTFKTVITNRRIQLPNIPRTNTINNNIINNTESPMIRTVKSMANTSNQACTSSIANGSTVVNGVLGQSVTRTFIANQKTSQIQQQQQQPHAPQQQQQQQQQQTSLHYNRKSNIEKTIIEPPMDPLQIKIKTEQPE